MPKTLLEIFDEEGISYYDSSQDRKVAHCPFHKGDREPSFTIYPDLSYWCFGCRVWGNAVKFLVEYKGLTAKEAIEIVGEDYSFPKKEKRVIKLKNLTKSAKFLKEVADKYHENLFKIPGPQHYLEERGLNLATIKKFKIGYTDGGVLDFQFAEEYELANEMGLLNKAGYESMSHRITIPNIIDDRYCDFMTGRTVVNDKIKYLGVRMPKPLCGFYDFRKSPILFVVEGNFDYLILRQWGYPAIVMSGSHISKLNYGLLRDRVIVVVPDIDETGIKAAKEIKNTLPSSVILDYSALGAKDIGELATMPGAEDNFREIVTEQLWPILSSNLTWTKYLPISIDITPWESTLSLRG